MAAWCMDLATALTATGILAGVAVVFLVLWDVLLSPVVAFALKLGFYVALGTAVAVLAMMLF